MLQTKRVYEPPDDGDGLRVLCDRLWPRGVKKSEAHVDVWLKEIGPSTELRKYFAHDPARFHDFAVLYERELDTIPVQQQAFATLRGYTLQHDWVTLLYAARDETHNHVRVLVDLLNRSSR